MSDHSDYDDDGLGQPDRPRPPDDHDLLDPPDPAAGRPTLGDAKKAPPPTFPPDPLPPIFRGGSLNVIGGGAFAGKTPLIAWLVRQFSAGCVLSYPVPAGAVSEHVFITTGSWRQHTREWFGEAPVRAYSLSDDLAFDAKGLSRKKVDRHELFAQALDRLRPHPHSVVWVDPLTTFFNGSLLDPDACFLNATYYRRVALEHQITLIGTAISSKQKISAFERHTTLLNKVSGSASFFGHMDTCLYLAPPEELERTTHTLGLYPRRGAPQQMFDLKQLPDGSFDYATPVEAHSLLRGAIPLAPDSITTTELQARLCPPGGSISRATLFRYLRQALDAKVIVQVGKGVYQRVGIDT